MGIFNFLKKKELSEAIAQNEKTVQKEAEAYLGDLDKTSVIFKLIQTPRHERDEAWQNIFLDNIGQASFRCGDPQITTGPDGFLYFQLFLPEPNKSFQCYVIENMKDDFLLSSGFGIVINPAQNSADWVLTYGDILNYSLNKTFYTTTETTFSKSTNNEIVKEDEKVMIGQPSETILPKQTRHLISEFLKLNGINTPKIALMMRHTQDENGISQDIVFNLTPNSFKDESTYNAVMRSISWYLPRHYSFIGMDEQSLGNGFMPL